MTQSTKKNSKYSILRIAGVTIVLLLLILLLGIIGLVAGAYIGGNYGCFAYMGMLGYEACGIFFGQVGVLVGIVLSAFVLVRSCRTPKRI